MDSQKLAEFNERAEKKKAKEEEAFLNSLFKTTDIKQEEPEEGQEFNTVLCAYFKAGACKRGDKCKYSHDMNIEFNVY